MSDEMKEWKKQLLSDRKNGYDKTVDQDAMEAYCAGYKDFLDRPRRSGSAPLKRSVWRRRRGTGPMPGAWK